MSVQWAVPGSERFPISKLSNSPTTTLTHIHKPCCVPNVVSKVDPSRPVCQLDVQFLTPEDENCSMHSISLRKDSTTPSHAKGPKLDPPQPTYPHSIHVVLKSTPATNLMHLSLTCTGQKQACIVPIWAHAASLQPHPSTHPGTPHILVTCHTCPRAERTP